ncbi:MAG: hypothetical protein ACXWTY_11975, partial [Methylobacter sp.]
LREPCYPPPPRPLGALVAPGSCRPWITLCAGVIEHSGQHRVLYLCRIWVSTSVQTGVAVAAAGKHGACVK